MRRILLIAALGLLLAFALGSAHAQGVHCSNPVPNIGTNAVGSVVVRSTVGNTFLCGFGVTWHSAAPRWVMIFNATSLPANGAVTPVYCNNLTPTAGAADGSLDFDWVLSPLVTTGGMVIAVSTNVAGCSTLTVDGGNDRFDVQAITP